MHLSFHEKAHIIVHFLIVEKIIKFWQIIFWPETITSAYDY